MREAALSASLGGGFTGLAVERRENAILQHTSFCFHPVLQGQSFLLAALIVEMLRMQPDLSLEQFGQKRLLLFSSGIGIQDKSSSVNRSFLQFYSTGKLLTEDYIGEG